MVASLTGFGRAEMTDPTGRVAVELKSVNNRFLQLDIHVPYGYNWTDGLIRSFLSERVSRGKILLHLEIVDYVPSNQVIVNRPLLRQLFDLQKEFGKELGTNVPANLDGLLALPGVMKVDAERSDNETIWKRILPVLEQSVEKFVESRRREGENLAKDMLQRRDRLEALALGIEERVPTFRAQFLEKFNTRIKELAGQAGVDENRLAMETAIWADRSDISEELTRLKSHLGELGKTLQSREPIGRRIDFLVQELNREANTISNKFADLMVLQQILEVKCEIEKIREQAQNIE